MTYQVKAALIIGFSLCLLVAVVVADHFSAARSAQLENDGPGAPGASVLSAPARAASPTVSAPLAGLGDRREVTAATPERAESPVRVEPESPTFALPEPIVIANGPSASGGMAPNGLLGELLSRGEGVRPLMASVPQALAAPSGTGAEVVRRVPDPEPSAAESGRGTAAGSTPGEAVLATYSVRAGDTLYGIAKEVLGNGERWRELLELNRDRLKSADAIFVGQRLKVPAGSARPTVAAQRWASASGRSPRAAEPARRRTYTVKAGDTLGLIAQRELGTVKRQDELLRVNSSKIRDADEIYAGMQLDLPL